MGRALVVGGTGPTGPHVVRGLQDRGHEVTVLHRGTHELPELDGLEHLHADPHFREPVEDALGSRHFEVTVAAYGRLRDVADALVGRTDAFVAVGGLPVYPGYHEPDQVWPPGMAVLADETAADGPRPGPGEESGGARFSRLVREAESHVLALHESGALRSTILRYPSIYGPRQLYPREWSIIRRVLDGRPHVVVPDAGLTLSSRCAAQNAAQLVLAAVDAPDAAAGEVFNAGDLQQYSLAQWIHLTAAAAGRRLEVVSLPWDLAGPGRGLFPLPHTHHGIVSVHKAVEVLGYVEAVPATRALQETVAWLIDNPPDQAVVDAMTDRFDYAEEDRVVTTYRTATAELRASQTAPTVAAHPYPHPTRAGVADHRRR